MARARKPIEGNRNHDVPINGVEARALERAARGLRGDNITLKQADDAASRMMDITARYRAADRKAAKKAAKKK